MRRLVQKIGLTVLFASFLFVTGRAQKVTIRLADKSYDEFAFVEAIDLYEYAYKKDTTDTYVIRRLADANRQIGNTEEVEKWLKKLIDRREDEPEDLFNYSQALKSNGKYHEAEKWLKEYADMRPEDGRVNIQTSLLEYIQFLHRDSSRYEIHPVSINSEGSEMGATFYGKKVVFSSTKARAGIVSRKYKWNELPYLNMYIGDQAPNGNIINVKPFAPKLRTSYHDGPVSFDPNSDKVYVTRDNVGKRGVSTGKDGVVNLKIIIGAKEDGEWEYRGEFPYNSTNYSTGHPSIDNTGKVLYFASDMPGGYGGSDIYFSVYSNGRWSQPFNLGPKINTQGNEFFPYISNDGVLYFSSNGHGGLGGLDIYFSVPEGGVFNSVENMGFPVNSPKDDFAFVLDQSGTEGYFSSNRTGGKGNDDIYFLKMKYIPVIIKGVVKDRETGDVLANTKISVVNETGDTLFTSITRKDGQFEFEVNKGKNYIVNGQRESYYPNESTVETNKLRTNDQTFVELFLELKPPAEEDYPEPIKMETENGQPLQILDIRNVNFDVGSWKIESRVAQTIDELIEFLKKYPDMEVRVESHTDTRGDDQENLELSQNRAKAIFEYISSKGIDPSRVSYKGYGETRPLYKSEGGVDCTEAEHAANNRTIVKVVKRGEYKGQRTKRNVFYF